MEVWRGDSVVKQVFAYLGRTNRNRYFLLTGSQTSSEESDATTLSQGFIDILDELRAHNPS